MRYTLPFLLFATPLAADHDEDAFVEANVIGIFYHEMGHALIDQFELPVFGQEEDAADVASIFLIDALWDADAALDLAYDAAFGFAAEALMAKNEGAEIAYWGVHGPDEQRFYNTVCVFYGGDPEGREDFAQDMGLPEDRADYCEEEYDAAANSWGGVLDEMAETDDHRLDFVPGGVPSINDILRGEVDALNQEFGWPKPIGVAVEACDEANAFYDPESVRIVFCEEFDAHLRELYALTTE